jgi:hypothetical protein
MRPVSQQFACFCMRSWSCMQATILQPQRLSRCRCALHSSHLLENLTIDRTAMSVMNSCCPTCLYWVLRACNAMQRIGHLQVGILGDECTVDGFMQDENPLLKHGPVELNTLSGKVLAFHFVECSCSVTKCLRLDCVSSTVLFSTSIHAAKSVCRQCRKACQLWSLRR